MLGFSPPCDRACKGESSSPPDSHTCGREEEEERGNKIPYVLAHPFPLLPTLSREPGMARPTFPHEGRSSSCYLLSGPTLREYSEMLFSKFLRREREAELMYTRDELQCVGPAMCMGHTGAGLGNIWKLDVSPGHMSPFRATTGPSPLHPFQFHSLRLPHETCASFSHRPC